MKRLSLAIVAVLLVLPFAAQGQNSSLWKLVGTSVRPVVNTWNVVFPKNASGAGLLTLSKYRTCTLKTTATGMTICGTDNSGSGGGSVNTGALLNAANDRFVNVSGDTMTGSLAIDVLNGIQTTIGLETPNTISGAHIHANASLSVSGATTLEGNFTMGASTFTLNGSVYTFRINSEGVPVSNVYYIGDGTYGSLDTNGLSLLGASTIRWNSTAFTASDTGLARLSAGIVKATNGSTGMGQFYASTLSGYVVKANNSLSSSGTLVIESGSILQYPVFITTNSGFTTSGLRLRNYITPVSSFRTSTAVFESWTQSRVNNPAFVFTSTGSTGDGAWNLAEFQNKGSTKFAIDQNGGFTTNSAITVQPHVLTKSSTQSLFLHFGVTANSAVSSNNIGGIFAAASTVAASKQVVGSQWDGLEFFIMPNVKFGIGTTDPGSPLSVSGSAIIGTNITTQTADTGIALEIIGTASGRTVYAQQSLRSSGSLVWEGTGSGASLTATTLSGTVVRAVRYSPRPIGAVVFASGSTVTTGSGKTFLPVPRAMSGYILFDAQAEVMIAGATNATTVQVRNANKNNCKMFSTPVTIDSAGTTSITSATPFVLNSACTSIGAGHRLLIDIPGVSTTAPKVLSFILYFYLP